MSDIDFDSALLAAFFRLAAEKGWRGTSVAEAARAAALPLAEARVRFPGHAAVLLRFGRMADQAALAETPSDGTVRDKLFDLLMRRFDALQAHRAGVIALLRAVPTEPPTALLLACATRRSMRWMLETAGVSTAGLRGELRVRGLFAVWVWTLRAWQRDESADLSGTMAALDAALRRADRLAAWLGGDGTAAAAADATAPDAAAPDATAADASAAEPGAGPAGPIAETPPA
ncbi:MAG TPA: TetR family transcriptional regulator [Acetobacteraceae bacterium]|nr:TetR family transcriptional regulator [Acetobacteraceae bacterium]